MRMRYTLKQLVFAASLLMALTSCKDWLQVDMEDGIMKEALFSSNEGFLSTLNGLYSNLNSAYVPFLTMGPVDVMAQYYNVQGSGGHPYYAYANYTYSNNSFDGASASYWSRVYALIFNANMLLEECDKENAAIVPRFYNMVKGETLALRAMLHLDLLRFYGPVYNQGNSSLASIPYLETTDRVVQDILPAKQVVEKIFRDLNEAEQLLVNDSIRTNGVLSSESEDANANNNFRYRQYRMNYYAVRTLQARAYMWIGENAKAFEIVKELIREIEEREVFPWVLPEVARPTSSSQDKVFSTEVIFALYNTSRGTWFNSIFSEDTEENGLHFLGGLSGGESKVEDFYGIDAALDYRKNQWTSKTDVDGKEYSYFTKYSSKDVPNDHCKYMIPLIRLSEIYLMAAECTSSLEEATEYINTIRLHRSANNVYPTRENLDQYIQNEFARETIGEGQLFFYYKRHAAKQMNSGTAVNAVYNMNVDMYQVPLPTVETNYDR